MCARRKHEINRRQLLIVPLDTSQQQPTEYETSYFILATSSLGEKQIGRSWQCSVALVNDSSIICVVRNQHRPRVPLSTTPSFNTE